MRCVSSRNKLRQIMDQISEATGDAGALWLHDDYDAEVIPPMIDLMTERYGRIPAHVG